MVDLHKTNLFYIEYKKIFQNILFIYLFIYYYYYYFFVFLPFLGPRPRHMGGSQARGRIGAVATGLHQGHSNAGSEPRLRPTPQLMATPDRQPTEQGQGPNQQPHGS